MKTITTMPQILIIEDNLGDARLVNVYLKDVGFKHEFHHAETFYEGVTMINEKDISLVLLDLSLPDSHGFKTLTNFRVKFPRIPVIVLTGLNDEIVGNQAIKAGAQDFLVKGQFDSKLLGRVIRYSLQRHKDKLQIETIAEERLISEKRFIEAQKMAHFSNWEVDTVTNSMKWADEVYRIFGHQPKAFQPSLSDYYRKIHHADREKVEETFNNAMKDGQLHKVEYRIIVPGNKPKYLNNQVKMYYSKITDKYLLVGAVQDITEQVELREARVTKNLRDKASKLKEEVLEDMGFHIRTPLSTISSFSFLLERTSLDEQQQEFIDGLKSSISDLSVIVNNLLNFSILSSQQVKIEETQFRTEELWKGLQKMMQIKADNKNIKLDFSVSEEVPEQFIADENKIQQIVYNLLDNAVKHTDEGGKVNLDIAYSGKGKKGNLFLTVQDNGEGMPSSKIKELRESDKLLEENYDHTTKKGLGLAIVSKLTKTLGGEWHISSQEGIGSKFVIELPIKPIRLSNHTIGEEPLAPLRILLVEDHFLNQMATRRVLTNWSDFVTVDIAENGLIAVEKFRAYDYDLVLMDLQMPIMNGFEATQKIRERNTEVPILALSAHPNSQESENCFKIGMSDYLSKPFKPQDLFTKIMIAIS